jgi:hypothetical protein
MFTLRLWLKNRFWDGRGWGKAISAGILPGIDLEKTFPKDIMRSWALILRKGNHNQSPPFSGAMVARFAPWETGRGGSLLPQWFRAIAIVEPL